MDRRLLSLAAPQRGLRLTVFLGLAAGVATVWQAFLLADIIDGAFLRHLGMDGLHRPLSLLLLAILLRAFFAGAERSFSRRLALDLSEDLKERIIRHLGQLSPLQLENEQAGEIQSGLGEGIEALRTWFGDYLPQVLLSAAVPLTILLFVLPRDLLSAAVLLMTAPLIPLFMVLIGGLAEKKATQRFSALHRMGGRFLDIIQGLTTLKILGRSRDYIETIRHISSDLRHTTMAVLRQAFLSALALELLSTLSTAIVAVEVGLRLLYGHMDFRDAFLIVLLAPEFYLPLRLLGQRFHAGIEGVAAADRLLGLLELPLPTSVSKAPTGKMSSHPCLELIGVSAAYHRRGSGQDTVVLDNIDFRLEVGMTVAVTGPSGGGKTTLARLLLRFLEPLSGQILADGIPAEEISLEQWWSRISWVGQEASLIHGSIRDNLRLARPEAAMRNLERAAEQAQALSFIRDLPTGWDTPLGEGGARLSGGQTHRLALARAFLRESPIVILDEPGEGLDPLSLNALGRATGKLLEGRTALVIAHRQETLRRADTILRIAKGRILTQGRPEDLLVEAELPKEIPGAEGLKG